MQAIAPVRYPMIPHNSLQPLHDLDKSSPQFHQQLIEFLRGDKYQDVVPTLQTEDLAWFVEYLDNVSLPIISPALRSEAA